MATIFNNSEITLNTESQNVVRNACANHGVDECYVQHVKGDKENIFHIYGDEDYSDYLFSIDTDVEGKTITFDR